MQFSTVTPETVDIAWPPLAPMIERGLKHGQGDCTTSAYLREAVRRGDNILWIAHDHDEIHGGCIFAVEQHPTGRRIFIHMLAGRDFAGWIDEGEKLLMDYRDLLGAKSITASCRPGMARTLKSRGWKQTATIMELVS